MLVGCNATSAESCCLHLDESAALMANMFSMYLHVNGS